MIDKKAVIIGFIISIALVLGLGYILPGYGQFIAVLAGSFVAGYMATKKNETKVVEAAIHGIIVGIFTGVVQILIIYVKSGFSEAVAGILIIAALILIGAYIIIGALGGLLGTLIQVKYGKPKAETEEKEEIEIKPDK
jgi:hypothetical protein